MRSPTPRALYALVAMLPLHAQETPSSAGEAWNELQRNWNEADAPPDAATKISDLRGFLQAHREGRWAALAACHLGALHLRAFAGEPAERAFTLALQLTPDDTIDLYGWALYGLAQAQELRGHREDALASLERIGPRFEGTRYHRFARVALRRLSNARPPSEVGKPMPPLRLGADVRTSAAPPRRDQPWLLVFFHAERETTIDAVEQLQEVWDPAVRTMIAIDLSGQRELCARLARKRNWPCHTISSGDGFLHSDALQLGVTATPSWFVVDRAGTLLARDIPAMRLRRLVR